MSLVTIIPAEHVPAVAMAARDDYAAVLRRAGQHPLDPTTERRWWPAATAGDPAAPQKETQP